MRLFGLRWNHNAWQNSGILYETVGRLLSKKMLNALVLCAKLKR